MVHNLAAKKAVQKARLTAEHLVVELAARREVQTVELKD